jgi:glucans biosynthesis protein
MPSLLYRIVDSSLLALVLLATLFLMPTTTAWSQTNASCADDLAPYLEVNSFETLSDLAQRFAKETYQPTPIVPKVLTDLSYPDYQKIEFLHHVGIWAGSRTPFWFETFHRGYIQQDKIDVFTLENGVARHVPYSKELFDYAGVLDPEEIPADIGHAGLKIAGHFSPQEDGRKDEKAYGEELLTFLGSSYFRSRPENFDYGSSARALAVNISMNVEEEFPYLRAFWVEKPANKSRVLTILALLDSPSVTGAYRFTFKPGIFESGIDVQARLYFRVPVEKLAIAPITSMWMWGDGFEGPRTDNRPSVHDSDGVLINSAEDGWIWRPLTRHSYPSVSSRRVETLKGFGALQRNRAFFHFEDYNANYHKRPSVYVTPKTPWHGGRVEISEFPAPHEGIDNINAYWVFDDGIDFTQPMDVEYNVKFLVGDVGEHNKLARATSFSVDRSDGKLKLAVRFAGGVVEKYQQDTMPNLHLKVVRGRSVGQSVERTDTKDLMAIVTLEPEGDAPIEIEMLLQHDGEPLTETFLYVCPTKQPAIPKK